mmetsp:Transcript_75787/g.123054  ORF Transcript_75787/g.123054 Transcript_75787/m.123054 type:complete len:181 (+) Transcript_75787:1183-1725(+)
MKQLELSSHASHSRVSCMRWRACAVHARWAQARRTGDARGDSQGDGATLAGGDGAGGGATPARRDSRGGGSCDGVGAGGEATRLADATGSASGVTYATAACTTPSMSASTRAKNPPMPSGKVIGSCAGTLCQEMQTCLHQKKGLSTDRTCDVTKNRVTRAGWTTVYALLTGSRQTKLTRT